MRDGLGSVKARYWRWMRWLGCADIKGFTTWATYERADCSVDKGKERERGDTRTS